MKAVSFLGIGNYQEITYTYNGQECRTKYFPVAVYDFFHPSEFILLVTQKAYDMHFTSLENEFRTLEHKLGQRVNLKDTKIPEGKTEEELWEIFGILTSKLNMDDKVIFDVTLAFRSLPVLSVIAIIYLHVAKNVELDKIIYGAFDARNEGKAPVFDLSPFLTLIEWTVATDKFLKTGNATELVHQLKSAHRLPHKMGNKGDELPRQLQNVATTIESIAQAIGLVRPHQLMELAVGLADRLEQVRSEAQRWAKPFTVLLDQIQHAYTPLALDKPLEDVFHNLEIQRKLINWYLDKGQHVQAITLAREWVVSIVTTQLGYNLISDRQKVEDLLNEAVKAKTNQQPLPSLLQTLENTEDITKTWNWLQDLRNDVAHAGMRSSPRPVGSIIRDTDELGKRTTILASNLHLSSS